MAHRDATRLPCIGTRVEFLTAGGRRMGAVQHHGGRRALLLCPPGDPDSTQVAVKLSEADAHSLVDALGVVSVTEETSQRTNDVVAWSSSGWTSKMGRRPWGP